MNSTERAAIKEVTAAESGHRSTTGNTIDGTMVIEPGLMDMLGNSLFDMLAPVTSTESGAAAAAVVAGHGGSGDGPGGRGIIGPGSTGSGQVDGMSDDDDMGSGGSGAGGSGGLGPGELWYRHSPAMTAVYCFAYTMVFLVGLVGNLLVVSVVCRSPRMRNVTNYFIVNLALADILVLVFCLPATLLSNIYVREYLNFKIVNIFTNILLNAVGKLYRFYNEMSS